jgi:hypothetical protein
MINLTDRIVFRASPAWARARRPLGLARDRWAQTAGVCCCFPRLVGRLSSPGVISGLDPIIVIA